MEGFHASSRIGFPLKMERRWSDETLSSLYSKQMQFTSEDGVSVYSQIPSSQKQPHLPFTALHIFGCPSFWSVKALLLQKRVLPLQRIVYSIDCVTAVQVFPSFLALDIDIWQ